MLSATADDYNGIDLSAATTGNSSIDASAADNTNANLFLIGGAGKNTIKGGEVATITGGAKADTLIGGAGAPSLVAADRHHDWWTGAMTSFRKISSLRFSCCPPSLTSPWEVLMMILVASVSPILSPLALISICDWRRCFHRF